MATEQSELDALRRRVAQLQEQLSSVQPNWHRPTAAEAALRESEETYRALFNSTDQGYFLAEVKFDEANRPTDIFYLHANPAATRMVGQDYTGRHLRDIDANYERYWYEVFGRVARSGIGERSEQYAAPDQRWYDFFVFKVGGAESSRVAVIFQDITERKRADEKLRNSEERFRAFVTASSDVVYRMSADWSEMLHLQGKDFIADTEDPSRTWLEKYIHPNDHGRVIAAIQHAIHTKTPFELDHRVIRVDGSIGWTFSRAIPLLDDQGSIIEWFGAARDVTERRQDQEALVRLTAHSEQQRRLYDTVLSTIPDLVYVFDLQHRFTYANKALLTIWGKSQEEAIGKNCLELGYEPWHAAMHDREIEQVIATKQPIRGEVPFSGTHGQRFYDYIFVPVLGESGQVEAVTGATRDVTERKQAEAELRQSEERSRLMADAIPQIVWVTDAEGRLEFFNRQWSEYTGVPFQPITATEAIVGVVHPEDQRATIEGFDEARQNGTPFRVEHRIRSLEGLYRWFLVRAEPHRDPSTGQVIRWFGSSTDIHHRKQAEAQHEFLLTLSDAIRPLRDPEAIKAAASRVLCERLQAHRAFYAEVEGNDWVVEGSYALGVPPLSPGRYGADTYGGRIMETYRAGKRMVFCDVRSDRDFTSDERAAHVAIKILAAAGVPLLKEGKLVAILTVHSAEPRNWTEDEIALVEDTAERTWAAVERARAEAALRESEERLTYALQAGGGVGTFDWDVPGDRLYCDARFAQLFSVDPEFAASGAPLAQFVASIHPDDRGPVKEKVEQACKTGDYAAEYRIVQPDGSVRWVLSRGRCHHDAAANPTRFLGVIFEVTPQVLARKELERVNKELEEFAYVASHDLQEPLRMVNIYTQLLIRRHAGDVPQARQYADIIHRGVSRMEELIHDLLAFSRTIHPEDEVPIGTADLSKALTEATSVLKDRIEATGAAIVHPLLPHVRGDTAQISQVFQNLLSNAIKYQANGTRPEVNITATCDGNLWTIAIRDNGIGFDTKYSERIFGLFKRLHKDEYPGTGLGLAICRRIVERHGGRIWAESTPGEGSTFYFSMPRSEGA